MTPRRRSAALALLAVPALALTLLTTAPGTAAAAGPGRDLSWRERPTGTAERFRGLSPVSAAVAWVSGTGGTVLRTTDGGRSWKDVSPGVVDGFDTRTLQFRDIEAFDARRAVILSIGEGADSRIYRTSDGGRTWRTAFVNAEPTAFYDCLAFWDDRAGLALSDPVDGRFRLQRTTDGGRTWTRVDPAGMPAALPGEFAFAASGTCLVAAGDRHAWIGSGGASSARVFSSDDRGRTWTVADSALRAGPTAGVYSLAFRGPRLGVAVGGAFDAEEDGSDAAAYTRDGGATWHAADRSVGGYRSGSAYLPPSGDAFLAVGPSGSDVTFDGGRTWRTFDDGSLDSVACTPDAACWGSGENGRVTVLHRRG